MQTSFTQATRPTSVSLLVADGTCPQIRELLAAAEAPVLWLDGQEPPLEAVGRALAEQRGLGQPVDTLHWVSHGSPGQLHMGSTKLSSGALLANAANLAGWGLTNLALWSCRAGADRTFIALWEELTGASLWSSEGEIGATTENGQDWKLQSSSLNQGCPHLPISTGSMLRWRYSLSGGFSQDLSAQLTGAAGDEVFDNGSLTFVIESPTSDESLCLPVPRETRCSITAASPL